MIVLSSPCFNLIPKRKKLRLRSLGFLMTLLMGHAAAFSLVPSSNVLPMERRSLIFLQGLSNNDDDEKPDSNVMDFTGFNPLKYQKSATKTKSANSYSGTQISLRQTIMQELTNRLLDAVGNEEATKLILEEYQDFLLEPLENDDAVLEPESIYSPSMSRDERYGKYEESMNERIEACKNNAVREVLTAMKDYVVNFKDATL